MTKSMKAVRDRKTDNRRISQNMEKAFKKIGASVWISKPRI